ncbi:hypothetical protein E1293_22515 [Actinomadura darangshiensis]|uniref:OmpA-like domain-containing protein n=1 Tax=Actinomadura darangshiensis TaxID=705336 RepID=A0A4R5B442_9ACTN|nr:OmpA family protein [Actinomadura darangshiensis]TDD79733.1 hypothetical protein E1293_22515 [Actinomadura darangshiensis]
MRVLPLAVSLAGLLLVAGCGDPDKAEKVAPPTVRVGGAPSSPAAQTGAFSKEGWFGGADGLHARLAIRAVERQGSKAVLRYSVTSMDSASKTVPLEIALVDPVGRRLYKPTGTTSAAGLAPGTTREMAAEYPPIPADVQKVTAITPGTAGEFTGIPVTSGSATPTSSTPTFSPSGGYSGSREPALPLMAPTSPSSTPTSSTPSATTTSTTAPGGNPVDLYGIVEGETQTVASSRSGVTVSLGGDVLFETNTAKLSSQAKDVLDDTAEQIKAKASRALTIEGHAGDSKLSGERAQAVQKELKSRLGDDFTYAASGKQGGNGVDISYQLKSTTSGGTSPATFRAQDGQKVGTRTASFGKDKRRLEVKPFHRDGAYIVAVFDIVDEGPGTTPPDASYPSTNYPGGVFGSFSIQVPGQKDVYRAVRVGPATPGSTSTYIDPGRAVFRTAVNEPVRGFVYLPAPPGNVTSVTFDAGPFGKVDKVPVS